MDDRITEIREALAWWYETQDPDEYDPFVEVMVAAARAYVGLVDSGALGGTRSLYVGTCQTCPHDTGRCKARKATVNDLIETLRVDSDALIIRRDENGEWPETVTCLIGVYDGEGQAVPFGMVLDHIADALASSQGVEP